MPQSSSQFSSNFSSNFTSTPSLNMPPMSVATPLTPMPAFDKHGLDSASLNKVQQVIGFLDSSLRLPNNPRAFAVYAMGLVIVFAGAFLHVLVAAQIMQAEVTLARLEEDFRVIEQQNGDIIFQIARDSNLARLHERVLAHGYVPVQEREFVFVPSSTIATAPIVNTAVNAAATLAAAPTTPATTLVAATMPPTTQVSLSSKLGGQVARWEEFLFNTFRSATGRDALPSTATSTATSVVKGVINSSAQPTNTSSNFWAVWWEQASDQGTKLLDQFRNE